MSLPNPLKALTAKEEATAMLREAIGGGVRRASRDPHSRRAPRACGITVHPGWGCRLGCLYCYVPDMGFPPGVRPYPLSGWELAYALATNPYVVPGRTLAAVGSVTEPLLPELAGRTVEYVRAIRRWLELPTQLSTKLVPGSGLVKTLSDADPCLSVLVSAATISRAADLEPRAPNPLARISGWGRVLRDVGRLRADLFLRPLIPGITACDDIRNLLHACAKAGFAGVVTGSLRITSGVLRRLATAGVDVNELLRRAGLKAPPRGRVQTPVNVRDLKEVVAAVAKALGIQYLPSACAANVVSHGMTCWLCRWGPCGDPGVAALLREVLTEGLSEYAEPLLKELGMRLLATRAEFVGGAPKAVIRVRGGRRRALEAATALLRECLKVRVSLTAA